MDNLPVNGTPLEDAYHPENPTVAFFKCPTCVGVEPSLEKAFQYKDLDVSHTCVLCRKSSMVRNWKCECDILWHNCDEHRYCTKNKAILHSSLVTNHTPLSGRETRGKKRKTMGKPIQILSYQEMLDQDIEAEARKKRSMNGQDSEVNLGAYAHKTINPKFLGTTLTRRFSGSRIVRT